MRKAIPGKTGKEQGLQVCSVCGEYSQNTLLKSQCPTCDNDISLRKNNSLQRTWALLFTAIVFIVPANVYPITYLIKNNVLSPDTIFSGIIYLAENDMQGIAFIVFVASILVPILKIIALGFIVLSVQKGWVFSGKTQLHIFTFVDWIGRWSVLDLFVISIMVAAFDKGSLLSVYPGIAASSFTIVVITTLFAANSFDTRLIFDNQKQTTNLRTNESDAQEQI